MRITPSQIEFIRSTARQLLGNSVRITLFGSRVDDALKGGDVDLLLEVQDSVANPAMISARMASRISRVMSGRKVDVIVKAPNLLPRPIHVLAIRTGILL